MSFECRSGTFPEIEINAIEIKTQILLLTNLNKLLTNCHCQCNNYNQCEVDVVMISSIFHNVVQILSFHYRADIVSQVDIVVDCLVVQLQ